MIADLVNVALAIFAIAVLSVIVIVVMGLLFDAIHGKGPR